MNERTSPARRAALVGSASLVLIAGAWACGSSGSTSSGDGGIGSFTGSSSGGGSGGSTGSSSGSGTNSGTEGVSSTCIVGSQGCLCDTTGGCGAGLMCTQQTPPKPPLCCSGASCTPTGGPIGSHCGTVQNGATCMPAGITIPMATGGNDNCGYPTSQFNESITLCGITAVGGGNTPATVSAFYADEHALTLGCTTAQYPVSPLNNSPDQVHYPQLGDPACTDSFNRPLRPVLYVTDISGDATCNAGDLQSGGTAYDPVAVYGTWKNATETMGTQGTPVQADPMANNWNNGPAPAANPVPATIQACMFNQNSSGVGLNTSYTAQVDFEVGLISGHSYRLQVIVHDGDQRRGGDSGEGCVTFCAGTGMAQCPAGISPCGAGGACPSGTSCAADGCCRAGGGDGGVVQ